MLKVMRQCPTRVLTGSGWVALPQGVHRGRGSGPKQFDERCRCLNDLPTRGRRSSRNHIIAIETTDCAHMPGQYNSSTPGHGKACAHKHI